MKHLVVITTLTVLLVWSLRAGASSPSAAPAFDLDDVAFLAGSWRSEAGNAVTEELWMPPRGGLMPGLNRSVRGSGRAEFEFLRLEATSEGVTYWASPGGAKPTPFRLVEAKEGYALFTNPGHDFPKRIEYRLEEDQLVASIAGDTPGPSWTFQKVIDLD